MSDIYKMLQELQNEPSTNKKVEILEAYKSVYAKQFFLYTLNDVKYGIKKTPTYNTMIESEIRPQCLKMIKWVVDLRCMQLFGRKVPDLTIKWQPLRVLTGLEEQDKENKIFQNVFGMVDRQLMLPSEAMEYLKRKDIVTMETRALKKEADEDYLNRVDMIDDKGNNNEVSETDKRKPKSGRTDLPKN